MKTEKDERSPGEFPLTYQMDASTRRVLNRLAISIPVLLLIISGFNLAGVFHHRAAPINLAWMNSLIVLLWIWVGSFTNRCVTLYDDAIEMTGWFSRRRLERKDILGYRVGRLAWQAGVHLFMSSCRQAKTLENWHYLPSCMPTKHSLRG